VEGATAPAAAVVAADDGEGGEGSGNGRGERGRKRQKRGRRRTRKRKRKKTQRDLRPLWGTATTLTTATPTSLPHHRPVSSPKPKKPAGSSTATSSSPPPEAERIELLTLHEQVAQVHLPLDDTKRPKGFASFLFPKYASSSSHAVV